MKTMKINKIGSMYYGFDEEQDHVVIRATSEEEILSEAKKMGYDNFFRTYKITAPINGQNLYMTRHYYTDAEPYEVIEKLTDKCYLVREMDAELTDESQKNLRDSFCPGGFFGHTNNDAQDWTFKSNESHPVIKVRLHKDGRFYMAGDKGTSFSLSDRPYKFYDYNF